MLRRLAVNRSPNVKRNPYAKNTPYVNGLCEEESLCDEKTQTCLKRFPYVQSSENLCKQKTPVIVHILEEGEVEEKARGEG